jgi:hypothetical protein
MDTAYTLTLRQGQGIFYSPDPELEAAFSGENDC